MRQARKLAFAQLWVKDLPCGLDLKERRVLLVSNHISWWDGFLLEELLHAICPHLPLQIPMIEEEFTKRRWMRRIGVVPLNPENPWSIRRIFSSIQTARRNKASLVTIVFPQGRIRPSFMRPLEFRRGISLFAQADPETVVIPVALHIEPLHHARPTVFAVLGSPLELKGEELDAASVERWAEAELAGLFAELFARGDHIQTQLEASSAWTRL